MNPAADGGGFPTSAVAALLGLDAGRVRGFVRAGVVSPARGARGHYRFGFQDLVLMRVVANLAAARVPGRRIVHLFRDLRRQLGESRTLSEVCIAVVDGRITATDGAVTWLPETGQLLLDLERPTEETVLPIAPVHMRDADEWFTLGEDLEATSPAGARDAYGRAIALAPDHADARVNLGRLLHLEGRAAEAAEHYRRALEADTRHVTAAFNLAVALEDQHMWDDAVRAYERTLELNPRLADAHFNLSRLHERHGDRRAALRHLRRYRELTG